MFIHHGSGPAPCQTRGGFGPGAAPSGGRSRLSTLSAGLFLITGILAFGDLIAAIPMGALVAVMIIVAVSTFDWNSIKTGALERAPRTETAVMVVTVAIVVATHNLALGVAGGVLLAAIFFSTAAPAAICSRRTEQPKASIRPRTSPGRSAPTRCRWR